MMKLLRFFIPLYVLLLSGQGLLHAHTQDSNSALCIENYSGTDITPDFGYLINDISIINTTPDFSKNYKFVVNDNEIEEDETISLKKSLEINNYFASQYLTQVSGYIYTYTKNSLPNGKLFFYAPSCQKYIIFRVIRL